jgi:hypothetical protein
MPVEVINIYLDSIANAFSRIKSAYIERYEEEILTPEKCNIRVRVRFSNGYLLEWNEAVISENSTLIHLNYRYHFQNNMNKIIFRYDNTPHFQDIKTFPHHKHCENHTDPSERPSVFDVLDEIQNYIDNH